MLKTNQSRRTAIGIAILVAFLAVSAVLYLRIGKPMVDMVRDPARLRAWLDGFGWKSRIVYAAMVCFQVIVAIIPGEPLELAAGYAFGAFEGTLICLAGIFVGSMIVFLLVRRFGVKLVRLFFSDEKINSEESEAAVHRHVGSDARSGHTEGFADLLRGADHAADHDVDADLLRRQDSVGHYIHAGRARAERRQLRLRRDRIRRHGAALRRIAFGGEHPLRRGAVSGTTGRN